MKEHSPGPWIAGITEVWPHGHPELAEKALNIHGGKGQPGYDGNIICCVAKAPHITEQDWANAHLLEAAPDLLEALEELLRIDDMDTIAMGAWELGFQAARAAIARARGETVQARVPASPEGTTSLGE